MSTVFGVPLPDGSDLRAQVVLMERLAERFHCEARELRAFGLYVVAQAVEFGAMALDGEVNGQLDFLRRAAAAGADQPGGDR